MLALVDIGNARVKPAVSEDGERAVFVLRNRTCEVRDTQTGSIVVAFGAYAPEGGLAAALSPDSCIV